jgi:hypothetical protein
LDYQTQLISDIFNASSSKHKLPGVQVYHNNFVENGIRALSITFPTLAYLIGEEGFRGLARTFLLEEVKTQFDWADYGANLASFLLQNAHLTELPYLSEVAELDYLLHEVQRSSDKEFNAESFNLLNEADPASLVFDIAPGFRLAKFYFPVKQLHRLAHDPELAQAGHKQEVFMAELNKSMNDAINLETPRSIVVWRPEYKAEMLSLTHEEVAVFELLHKKQSIDTIFARFTNEPEALSPWLSEQIVQKRIFGVLKSNEV